MTVLIAWTHPDLCEVCGNRRHLLAHVEDETTRVRCPHCIGADDLLELLRTTP